MDKYTFGKSQAATNLLCDILENPEYKQCSRRVARLLSKQFKALLAAAKISDKGVRNATLRLWHDKFETLTDGLPEVVKTHIRCVETGKFRQILKGG